MNNLRVLAVLTAFWCPAIANGDASIGELFGYKIGTQYEPKSELVRCEYSPEAVVAERPVVPSSIQTVCLFITPTSKTIEIIQGYSVSESERKTRNVSKEIQTILRDKYADFEQYDPPDEIGEMELDFNITFKDNRYYLGVYRRPENWVIVELVTNDKDLLADIEMQEQNAVLEDESKSSGL